MSLLAIRVPALQPAGMTGVIAAVRSFPIFYGTLIFPLQEGCGYSRIDMSPGQKLVQRALSMGVKAGFKSGLVEGLEPVAVVEMLTPGIKGATQLPGTVDDLTQSPVSPGDYCFEQADFRVLP